MSLLGRFCFVLWCVSSVCSGQSRLESELVFPLRADHNHAPGIVETPNGDLLVSWYRGSGERKADDVAVFGSRQRIGERTWSSEFLLADHPDFPDCNTCMFIDRQHRLWLFWPIILANSWESCLTNYKVATDYQSDPFDWSSSGTIFLKPVDFGPPAKELLAELLKGRSLKDLGITDDELQLFQSRLDDKLSQRLGWQPRCKPTQLRDGRIVLPLYSDTYSFSIMAISDDSGKTWHASAPLMGFGNIQPAVLEKKDGTLVAYMRENGPQQRVRTAESKDRGETWSRVSNSSLLNPGSGLDAVRLQNGNWLIVYNDTIEGRRSLAVSVSSDEGRSWQWTRHLEKEDSGAYHYPAVIQGKDETIHVVYSYFVDGGKSMKHAAFKEGWVREQ